MKKRRDCINLLPREEKKPLLAANAGVVIAAIFALAWTATYGWQVKQAWDLKNKLASLTAIKQARLEELKAVRKELGIAEAEAGAGTSLERATLINTLLGERVLWSEVFKQFSRIVPKGLWFDNLEGSTTGQAEIRIKGGAFNYGSVAEFLFALEKTPYFERAQLLSARQVIVQGQDVIGFEIVCGIKKGTGAR